MSDKPRFDAVIQTQDSSFISGVVYDHTRLIMDIQLAPRKGHTRGPIYRYRNVTPLEFTQLITSKSTGQTYNAVIKGKKKSTKLRREVL